MSEKAALVQDPPAGEDQADEAVAPPVTSAAMPSTTAVAPATTAMPSMATTLVTTTTAAPAANAAEAATEPVKDAKSKKSKNWKLKRTHQAELEKTDSASQQGAPGTDQPMGTFLRGPVRRSVPWMSRRRQ